jgi:hypothetical protein
VPDQQLPPCGIGGAAVGGGSCTGTYKPSQAGQDAFHGLSTSGAVSALIGAGAILAGLIFVCWIVAVVGGFFDKKKPKPVAKKDTADYLGWMAEDTKNFDYGGFGQALHDVEHRGDFEDDNESDTEDDSSLDEKAGADLTDKEFDDLEWREEYRREHEGDL